MVGTHLETLPFPFRPTLDKCQIEISRQRVPPLFDLGDPAHVDAPKLHRLLFESYTMTVSELRRKVDNNETDAPKKLPVQEVASRFAALQAKLDPIRMESILEPSHQLINFIAQCLDDGRV